MRDIQTVALILRDDSVPATLTLVGDELTVTSPVDLDDKAKGKLVKRFADYLLELGFNMYDWKETI